MLALTRAEIPEKKKFAEWLEKCRQETELIGFNEIISVATLKRLMQATDALTRKCWHDAENKIPRQLTIYI